MLAYGRIYPNMTDYKTKTKMLVDGSTHENMAAASISTCMLTKFRGRQDYENEVGDMYDVQDTSCIVLRW